jgi:hypothetical protein
LYNLARSNMRTFFFLLGLLPAAAMAQVPAKLSYQGRLLNPDGTAVSGT